MQYVISKEITDTTEYLSFDDLTINTLLPLVKQSPQEYGESVEKYLIEITEPNCDS
ncbi:hypothetical protein PFDG_05545 [Plasmodium falciparum Dd2]|uniref:Uncharacterized protein n=1 Tax=Plasmodium falciparum (isolate Dd2) TaxID=57267 RepID=A0A0L7M4C1_PLAF4|nr:hypothetical protein PFDG_05545 [Plasmodium falciparum Dd2]